MTAAVSERLIELTFPKTYSFDNKVVFSTTKQNANEVAQVENYNALFQNTIRLQNEQTIYSKIWRQRDISLPARTHQIDTILQTNEELVIHGYGWK